MKVQRVSRGEFHGCGISTEKSTYFLPIFGKIHWRRLDVSLNLMLENLDLNYKYIMADFGCGIGIFTRSMSKVFRNSKIIGLDYTKSLIHARKLCPANNTMFLVGDIQNIPVKSNSFDFIVSLDVLEHLDNPVTALEEIDRVLKPNGFLIVSIPLEMILLRLIRGILVKLKIIKDMPAYYYHYHGTIKSFKELCRVLGGIFLITKKVYTPLNFLGRLNYGCIFVCKKRGQKLC